MKKEINRTLAIGIWATAAYMAIVSAMAAAPLVYVVTAA